jgi:hypothetical protein
MNFRTVILGAAMLISACSMSVQATDASSPTDAIVSTDQASSTDSTSACLSRNVFPLQFQSQGGVTGGVRFQFTISANGLITVQQPNCSGGPECMFSMNRCRSDGPRSYEEYRDLVTVLAPIIQIGPTVSYGVAVPDGYTFTLRQPGQFGVITWAGGSCNGAPNCAEAPSQIVELFRLVETVWTQEGRASGCTCGS